MRSIEILEAELKQLLKQRDVLSSEDTYARQAHATAQAKFSKVVDDVKDLQRAIEVLENQ